jgi:hypothetical protein
MPTTLIPLTQGVPVSLASELRKRLFYVSDEIGDFKLVERDGSIQAVEVSWAAGESSRAASPEDVRRLEQNINDLVRNHILSQKIFPPKEVWRAAPARTFQQKTFDRLVREGIAFEAGEGQVGFGEPLISLMDYFDRRIKSVAMNLPNAKEYLYPTLLPTRVLEQCDYFNSFPQFVMFVTRLHNDMDVYRAFMKEYEGNPQITSGVFAHCRNHDYCLPPTMCYHSYHQHRGRQLEGDIVVTARGKSFRFESRYSSGLERLWDFTIREIVFMGRQEFVLECRQHFMRQAFSLMDELGLSGSCEVANDPFFVNTDTAGKIGSQRMMELKYELNLNVGPDDAIAVGSFNYHGNFFGQNFRITRETGKPVATGCVGFGLERLVYAFLCQHGLDSNEWPQAVRSALG